MIRAVFDYPNYKAYLRAQIDTRGRGEKSRIAEAARCHLAYVHQVMTGPADVSFEQADLLNQYFSHSDDEAEFFLLLVSLERAGSESLRRRYRKRIASILHDRNLLENRLKQQKTLPAETQATYYSAWYYSAIHLLLSIPEFQTKEAIADRLRLRPTEVTKALSFLVETGLAKFAQGRYQVGLVKLHMTNDSPWSSRHHASWRIQSIQSLEQPQGTDFHYTSTVSMSPDDLPKVRKILVDAIEEVRAVVRDSPEKDIVCYTLDCFRP